MSLPPREIPQVVLAGWRRTLGPPWNALLALPAHDALVLAVVSQVEETFCRRLSAGPTAG